MSMNFFMFKALTVTNLSNNTEKSTTTWEKICCWNVEEKQKKNLVADWKSYVAIV